MQRLLANALVLVVAQRHHQRIANGRRLLASVPGLALGPPRPPRGVPSPVEVVSSLASISSCRIAGSSRDPSIRCGTSWLYRTSTLWLFDSRTMLEMLAISAGAAAPVVVSGWPCARVVWVV